MHTNKTMLRCSPVRILSWVPISWCRNVVSVRNCFSNPMQRSNERNLLFQRTTKILSNMPLIVLICPILRRRQSELQVQHWIKNSRTKRNRNQSFTIIFCSVNLTLYDSISTGKIKEESPRRKPRLCAGTMLMLMTLTTWIRAQGLPCPNVKRNDSINIFFLFHIIDSNACLREHLYLDKSLLETVSTHENELSSRLIYLARNNKQMFWFQCLICTLTDRLDLTSRKKNMSSEKRIDQWWFGSFFADRVRVTYE